MAFLIFTINYYNMEKNQIPPGKWIRVQDGLPEEEGEILIFQGAAYMGWWYPESKIWNWAEPEDGEDLPKPTHWMKLPEPPQQESPEGEELPKQFFANLMKDDKGNLVPAPWMAQGKDFEKLTILTTSETTTDINTTPISSPSSEGKDLQMYDEFGFDPSDPLHPKPQPSGEDKSYEKLFMEAGAAYAKLEQKYINLSNAYKKKSIAMGKLESELSKLKSDKGKGWSEIDKILNRNSMGWISDEDALNEIMGIVHNPKKVLRWGDEDMADAFQSGRDSTSLIQAGNPFSNWLSSYKKTHSL